MVSCFNALADREEVELHVVHWEINAEAPFQLQLSDQVQCYLRDSFDDSSLEQFTQALQPDHIFVSGWIDKGYVALCKKMKGSIPITGTMDTPWKGSLKQQVARVLSPFTLKKYFDSMWVAGQPQAEYAKKLGFSTADIYTGFYSADSPLYDRYFQETFSSKKQQFPKRFLFVGRYLEFKGILELWEAFRALEENDWELWCLGTGELEEQKPDHPLIKHFGFVQPQEMGRFIQEGGVFVLPSHYEPWGVVVHEFALAGFPLLCSDQVGAASRFLEEGENGFTLKAKDPQALQAALRKVMALSEEELVKMGEASHALGMQHSPERWVAQINQICT